MIFVTYETTGNAKGRCEVNMDGIRSMDDVERAEKAIGDCNGLSNIILLSWQRFDDPITEILEVE